MTLFSIVNTMTELPGIEKVQFLIEGQNRMHIYMLHLVNPLKETTVLSKRAQVR